MELTSHEVFLNASPYQSAPTSPTGGSGANKAMQFYTAPSTPRKEVLDNDTIDYEFVKSNLDDFEFATSKKFTEFIELEIGRNCEYFMEDKPQQEHQEKPKRERGGSLPTMAFADELFYKGLVMPLKPPPRLQRSPENASFSQGSIPSSPKSPQRSGFKVPFVHRAAWNDDYDPFTAALQKVSHDQSRGRASNAGNRHRRTRSHSPFRTNNSGRGNQHQEKMDEKLDDPMQKFGLPKEPKGSPYARFVIDQKKQVQETVKGLKEPQKSPSRRRIRPVKTDHEGNREVEGNNLVVESGMKRIRSILLKYASFGKENNEEKASNQGSRLWKSSSNYFKKLSFKIKGNSSGNVKKRGIDEEPKMEIIEYKRSKPSLVLCLGYGFENHKNMDSSL